MAHIELGTAHPLFQVWKASVKTGNKKRIAEAWKAYLAGIGMSEQQFMAELADRIANGVRRPRPATRAQRRIVEGALRAAGIEVK